ncbi:MAG: nitrous oxide reductase accessory protein NosL [Thermoanaerobaculales bacterium]|jgi:nitrous oxide reductase accessory protein NosL|nr:nitrous oxide reductase accessory protein NosL [Thermoanaerobaculales bacterium]
MISGHRRLRAVALVCSLFAGVASAGEEPPPPGPKDRCALCGMFVAPYPAWLAALVEADGTVRYFDGPKDLFRYALRHPEATANGAALWVTDYYTTHPMRAREAFYVTGSDVLGPMGAELVPVASLELAATFRADHGGERALAYDDVDSGVLEALE